MCEYLLQVGEGPLRCAEGVRPSRTTVTVVRSRLLWILVTALALLEEHKSVLNCRVTSLSLFNYFKKYIIYY